MSNRQSIHEQINTLGELVNTLRHKTSFKIKLAFYKTRKKLKKFVSPRPEDSSKSPSSSKDYPT
jgi:hypothetical protein